MATISPPPLNLWVVLSESKRIINAQFRHFLALSVIFLLPISFSVTIYPSVTRLISDQPAASHNSTSLLRGFLDTQTPRVDAGTSVLLLIAYIVVVNVFKLLAIGSIAYSVFQGFHRRPVKLISAVKSGFSSFFPLLATQIFSSFIVFGILLILGLTVFLLTLIIQQFLPGLGFDYSSPYFQAFSVIVTIITIVIVIKLYVNWILAWVIVVVESAWGFTPLKRSKSLIKGMRGVSLSLIVFFSVTQSIIVWISTVAASAQIDDNDNGETWQFWTNAFFVFQIVITSAFLTVLTLYNLAAITVMYMHCMAFHGELSGEIAEKFAREYMSLPSDDGKAPHLVSVAYNNV